MFKDKILLFMICAFVALFIYNAMNIEKHPDDRYVLQNSDYFEDKQIFLRASVLDISKKNDEFFIKAKTGDEMYTIIINGELSSLTPSIGDIVDFRALSKLNEGYVVALEIHVRTELENKLLFVRSIFAIPIIFLALWREHNQLFGGY